MKPSLARMAPVGETVEDGSMTSIAAAVTSPLSPQTPGSAQLSCILRELSNGCKPGSPVEALQGPLQELHTKCQTQEIRDYLSEYHDSDAYKQPVTEHFASQNASICGRVFDVLLALIVRFCSGEPALTASLDDKNSTVCEVEMLVWECWLMCVNLPEVDGVEVTVNRLISAELVESGTEY
jgi:hypothetical protein